MRSLEARFYPPAQEGNGTANGYIVVGRIIWDGASGERRPRIEASSSLAQASGPASLLSTLRHLVLVTAPYSFERLVALDNRHWSFVSVERDDACTEI